MLGFIKFYQSLGKFTRWEIGDIFLIFPRKEDLTLHANCLQWRQFACNVKTFFLEKKKKKKKFYV